MQTFVNTYTAGGQTWETNIPGKYFILMEANFPVDVTLFKGGKKLDLGNMQGVLGGLEIMTAELNDPEAGFDRIQIVSSAADTIKIGVSNGMSRYSRMTGSVNVGNMAGTFSQAAANVTTASGQLLAANVNRRLVAIQNKDATGNIWVNLAGAAATAANGIKIVPGGVLELSAFCPTGAITAIGDIPANGNIVVVEGQ